MSAMISGPRRAAALRAMLALLAAILVGTAQPVHAQRPADSPPRGTSASPERIASRAAHDAATDGRPGLDSLEQLSRLYRYVAVRLRPSVVHIEARKDGNGGPGGSFAEAGAGVAVIVQGKLFVLTNRHVVADSRTHGIDIVTADRRTVHPLRTLEDPVTDVALLEIADNDIGLVAADTGDDSLVEIGEIVLAFGSPFGLSHSLTHGIISAKGRHDLDLGISAVRVQDFIQTDAAINPGNSGGPLLNLRGEVIGINTAIASNSGGNDGIGFAIPINLAMRVAEELVATGRVNRPYLGVKFDENQPASSTSVLLAHAYGARIKSVLPDSPAIVAGLLPGDVITTYNGVPIESHTHLTNLVALTKVDAAIPLTIDRQGKQVEVMATMRARKP